MRRNCLFRHIIEEKVEGGIEVMRRRRKQLLDSLKETRGTGKLREEALDRNVWRNQFGRGYGPLVRHTAGWLNE
jgi:hypothetical protein